MKISFNTQTVSHGDLVMLEHIISRLLSSNTAVKTSGEYEPDDEDATPAVDPSLLPFLLQPETQGEAGTMIEPTVLPPASNVSPQVISYVESPIEVLVAPFLTGSNPKIVISPPTDATVPGVRDPRDNPFREHSDATAPTQPVIPPPPPQVVAEVSTGSNEGMSEAFERDSDDELWDATVHSESRAKNVDGTWRKRRNTKNVEVKAAIPGLEAITPNSVPAPPAERKMVRTFIRIDGGQSFMAAPDGATDEELSAITGKPTMREDRYQAMMANAHGVNDTFEAHRSQLTPATTGFIVTAAPPAPPAPPPVVKTAVAGAPAGTFNELMERVTKHFAAQKITSVDLAEICKTFNIGSMQECFTQTHLIPLVSNAIDMKAASK